VLLLALACRTAFGDNPTMTPATEQKGDSMYAVEFQAQVSADRTIRLPDDLTVRVPPGKDVRVLVLWQEPAVQYEEGTDEEWAKLGALMMAKGYEEDPVDEDYDDLLKS
jgi:hypothetical protein